MIFLLFLYVFRLLSKKEKPMKVMFKQQNHDYPKHIGDLNLAWYAGGRICIARTKTKRSLQTQNFSIIKINSISKSLWEGLHARFKNDLAHYAKRYKIKYPILRKRGISSYAVFLMLIHTLIKRYSLNTENSLLSTHLLQLLLQKMSVKQAILQKLLKPVPYDYQLNQVNGYESVFSFDHHTALRVNRSLYHEIPLIKQTKCFKEKSPPMFSMIKHLSFQWPSS